MLTTAKADQTRIQSDIANRTRSNYNGFYALRISLGIRTEGSVQNASMAVHIQTACFIVSVLFSNFFYSQALNAANAQWVQRLNQFQQKYNNSRSDIIFLLDLSGSVSDYGFQTEKKFVNSLLSEISVQPIATRVGVVTFEESAAKRIDYIDYNGLDKNKCTFSDEFQRIRHSYGRATNMAQAFEKAKGILTSAKNHNFLRSNVNTVIVLITDGWWNYGGSPKYLAESLRSPNSFYAEIISVGVDRANQQQLREISGIDSNVIMARSFTQFEELAAKIRGGMTTFTIILKVNVFNSFFARQKLC